MSARFDLPRWPPLAPEYLVARGPVARALATRLLADPPRLTTLRGVVSDDLLALTGEELPWADGAEYFGRDGAASWLLVPTVRTSRVPTSWLERRYRAASPALDWPCLLLDDTTLLPAGRAASFDPVLLARWCGRE
ncbi:MAG: hypothetical protein ACOZQL_26530 [Myxococcota bacterium]